MSIDASTWSIYSSCLGHRKERSSNFVVWFALLMKNFFVCSIPEFWVCFLRWYWNTLWPYTAIVTQTMKMLQKVKNLIFFVKFSLWNGRETQQCLNFFLKPSLTSNWKIVAYTHRITCMSSTRSVPGRILAIPYSLNDNFEDNWCIFTKLMFICNLMLKNDY